MHNITIKDILNAKKNKEILVIRNSFFNVPKWIDFDNIFNKAFKEEKVHYQSFSSMTINNSENYSNIFNKILSDVLKLHNGKKIGIMSIIHFQNANNIILTDKDSKILYQSFVKNNNHKKNTRF